MEENGIMWLHPADFPPPHGVKVFIYMHPYGITVMGQWQNSGGTLWAPIPTISEAMRERLDAEHKRRTG